MTIAEHLLTDFRMEAEHTRKVLDAVPQDRFDWQPHEKSMSLQRLAGQAQARGEHGAIKRHLKI